MMEFLSENNWREYFNIISVQSLAFEVVDRSDLSTLIRGGIDKILSDEGKEIMRKRAKELEKKGFSQAKRRKFAGSKYFINE